VLIHQYRSRSDAGEDASLPLIAMLPCSLVQAVTYARFELRLCPHRVGHPAGAADGLLFQVLALRQLADSQEDSTSLMVSGWCLLCRASCAGLTEALLLVCSPILTRLASRLLPGTFAPARSPVSSVE